MSGPRFCPRCGTARVGDMAYCPACGLDLEHVDGYPASAGPPLQAAPPPTPETARPQAPEAAPPLGSPVVPDQEPAVGRPAAGTTFAADLPRPVLVGIAALALVALAWVVTGGRFLGAGASPTPTAGATLAPGVTLAPGATMPPGQSPIAPQVGLTILSPLDNSAVATRQVTVIGRAPAGVRVVQDISFGIDRSATADGTGHWAIVVDLRQGANELTFRIGDDRSTEKKLLVSYQPQPTP